VSLAPFARLKPDLSTRRVIANHDGNPHKSERWRYSRQERQITRRHQRNGGAVTRREQNTVPRVNPSCAELFSANPGNELLKQESGRLLGAPRRADFRAPTSQTLRDKRATNVRIEPAAINVLG
jgi:hypothetical protein